MFLPSSVCSVEAMAPVSCGAITITLAPWPVRAWVLATSLATSFCELVGGIRSTPSSVAIWGTYLLYEFQKSEAVRGKSMPTLAPAGAAAASPEGWAAVVAGSDDPQAERVK